MSTLPIGRYQELRQQAAERRANIAARLPSEELSARGLADEFGVSITTIHRDLAKIQQEQNDAT